MNEGPQDIPEQTSSNECEMRREKLISLAQELYESGETFSFPGIESDLYEKMKAEEEEFPGYVTPVDELLNRFTNEGIKIMYGRDHGSNNVFAVPANSSDTRNDGIFVRQLLLTDSMDEKIRELVKLSKDV